MGQVYFDRDGNAFRIADDVSSTRRDEILRERGASENTTARRRRSGASSVARHMTNEQAEVKRRADAIEAGQRRSPLPGQSIGNSASRGGSSGIMANFQDELGGIVGAAMDLPRNIARTTQGPANPRAGLVERISNAAGGLVRDTASSYRIGRDTEAELNRRARTDNPGVYGGMEVAGALATGLGPKSMPTAVTGTRGARTITQAAGPAAPSVQSRVAQRLANTRVGGRVARSATAQQLARSPMANAAAVGGLQGGINAAGASEADTLGGVLDDAGEGALIGAGTGAAFSGLTSAGLGVADFLRKGNTERVEERAFEAAGDLLDRVGTRTQREARRARDVAARVRGEEVIPGVSGAQQVERRLAASRALGTDEIVADQSASLRGLAGGLARNPNLDVANDLAEESTRRAGARADRFMGKLDDNVGSADAVAREVAIQQERRAAGTRDYNPSVMQKPFMWGDDLEDYFVRHPTGDTRTALREAADTIRNTRGPDGKPMSPEALGWRFNAAGDVEYMTVPNMETFDLVKRGYDAEIGAALRGAKPNRDRARRLSTDLNMLKQMLGDRNPGYRTALANQRDLFQKEEALEMGQSVLARLQNNRPGKGARELLAEIKGLSPNQQADYRLGIVDALTRMDSKTNPLQTWSNVTRSREQRDVMEWVFGSKKELNRFNRWVRRERNAAATDVATDTKAGSISSNALLAADALEPNKNPLFGAFAGYAFGGPVGGIAGAARALGNKVRGRTDDVQEIMGQILLSRGRLNSGGAGGETISEGLTRVGRRVARRKQLRRRVARDVGRSSQQLLSGAAVTGDPGYDQEY